MGWKDMPGLVCLTDILPSQYAFECEFKSVLKRHGELSMATVWDL